MTMFYPDAMILMVFRVKPKRIKSRNNIKTILNTRKHHSLLLSIFNCFYKFTTIISRRMSSMMKFQSEKGKPMLGNEGNIYTLERQTEGKMIFRCQNRGCKDRCHTNPSMDAILSGPTEHCHAPKPDLIPVVELRSKIKSKAG